MIRLDDNLLTELGLAGLPKQEKAEFLKHMYETLEMRVGTRLAERMTDAQMAEFERFINGNDEQGAFHWLEANFPDYKAVVAEEFEKLKVEIKPLADQILATSGTGDAANGTPDADAGMPARADKPIADNGAGFESGSEGGTIQLHPQAPASQPETPAPAAASTEVPDFAGPEPMQPHGGSPFQPPFGGPVPSHQGPAASQPATSFGADDQQQPGVSQQPQPAYQQPPAYQPPQPQPMPMNQQQPQPMYGQSQPQQPPYGQPQQPPAMPGYGQQPMPPYGQPQGPAQYGQAPGFPPQGPQQPGMPQQPQYGMPPHPPAWPPQQ